ncbi:MAG: hypothetical protein R2755_28075 [Acidimicrobiales bacterium]
MAVPVVIGCLAGPLYVGYIFGYAKWSDAGKVLAMMTPMIVGALLFSAIATWWCSRSSGEPSSRPM